MIDAKLAERLRKMAGFRNIFVHRYAEIDRAVIDKIVKDGLGDVRRFATLIATRFGLA